MDVVKAKVIGTPKYAARLKQACDACAACPSLHHGRLRWIKDELGRRTIPVTVESVRKWLNGEARPREDRSNALAEILNVDHTYLFVGKTGHISTNIGANTKDNHAYSDMSLPIAIRTDTIVRIHGLPLDLTEQEASKIANIVLAHAVARPDSLSR